MAELSTEEKNKIHKQEILDFLKHLIENPDHKIRIADMYSRDEALIKKADVPWFKVWDDPNSENVFLDYDDVLKALGLWEE
jgi:hypothetical protein